MDDIPDISTGESDQMMEEAGQLASQFMTYMVNGWIASAHGLPEDENRFIALMVDVLAPLDKTTMCTVVWELGRRLGQAMVEAVGGLDNLREALETGHVLGATTNKELAFRDLPPL